MNKYEVLLEEMKNDERPSRRLHAFDRLIEDFSDKEGEIIEAVIERDDPPVRKNLALILARRGDQRGIEMLKKELEAEFKSMSRDFSHWMWLATYLDFYVEKKDVRTIKRFYSLITVSESDIGFKIIQAIRQLGLKDGIPFLIKAAELKNPPHKHQEFAVSALGEIGGQESIDVLLQISRGAGAVTKRYAKEAIEKIRRRK